jgi:hypothetical protein
VRNRSPMQRPENCSKHKKSCAKFSVNVVSNQADHVDQHTKSDRSAVCPRFIGRPLLSGEAVAGTRKFADEDD